MAITLADFTKIWASTSPLTPYSFSDANYQEGWNFIGSTPPARQMWDSIQKTNDEKLKYIVDNFLPLNGGEMTGAIKGNPLTLTADDGNGNSKDLVCTPNGTMQWDGNNVVTNGVVGGHGIQMGDVANIAVSAGGTITGTVTFQTAFAGVPKVFVTQSGDYGNVNPCAGNISSTGFQWRLNSSRGSDVTTSIDWLAIY